MTYHASDTSRPQFTAAGQRTTAERARALGAAAFVTKPFSPMDLLARVRKVLASDAAAMVNGTILPVDGGWTAQ